jgi:hypothetical protein
MNALSLKKNAVAVAVVGALATASAPQAEANVVNLSWTGAFTLLNPTGAPIKNLSTDYTYGFYANGDSNATTFGTPKYPANAVNGTPNTYYAGSKNTTHGWYGHRTPISGTLSFDTSSGAGVGTITPFLFLGDTAGSGPGTSVARPQNVSFQTIDTLGTMVGTLLFSWNGAADYVSIVLDGSGLFSILSPLLGNGPTSSLSGVGVLPASNGIDFDPSSSATLFLPLGPSLIATKTLNNGIETGFPPACDGQPIATQVNAYTIIGVPAVINTCTTGMVDDGIGGDPMSSVRFGDHNMNLDVMAVHLDSFVPTPVPLPPAIWLFGSGLLGLLSLARHRRTATSGPII